jgi:hypothetical protein
MSLNSHSHRFDPRWLLPAIGSDGAELYGAPDASPCSAAEESTNDPTRRDFDEALEQIASDGCWVCPLCEAIEPAMLCTRVRSLASQAHRILTRMPCVHYEEGHELRQQLARLQMEIDRLRRFHSLRFDELQRWLDSLVQRVEDCCLEESA